jgi:hypothetical protein
MNNLSPQTLVDQFDLFQAAMLRIEEMQFYMYQTLSGRRIFRIDGRRKTREEFRTLLTQAIKDVESNEQKQA